MKKQTFIIFTLVNFVLFTCGLSLAAEKQGTKLATITVQAGPLERVDCPVSVTLPPRINAFRPMRLVETTGGKEVGLPFQIEPEKPPKLWFVLPGKTPAGSKRTFELRRDVPVVSGGPVLTLDARSLGVSIGGAPFFTYHHAHVPPPKGVRFSYIRSAYIHPLFSPRGALLTEDFPPDHLHHKGIWMPWTSTEFEGRHIDFWNLGKELGTVQFAGYEQVGCGPVYGRFKAKHQHVDLTRPNGGKVVLEEIWDVRAWAVGGRNAGWWYLDLTSSQTCVADSPLHLNAYRYGGLGYRGPKEWRDRNYHVLTSEGKTRKDGHATRAKWCAHSGEINGASTTVVIMCHPDNERFPEPMRIWPQGGCFFGYVPIQKKPMDLKPGETHVFRYRFYIYEGPIDRERAEWAWRNFAHPPQATIR